MKTLVDTCVISEARRSRGAPEVRARVEALAAEDLYLSVITIGEIVRGLEQLSDGDRRSAIETWLHTIEDQHGARLLPIDSAVARAWGRLDARARRAGVTLPVADGLIAATALRHDLVVMTRNTHHFEVTGVRVNDPWSG